MPEFYMMFAEKYISRFFFWGGGGNPIAQSPTPIGPMPPTVDRPWRRLVSADIEKPNSPRNGIISVPYITVQLLFMFELSLNKWRVF